MHTRRIVKISGFTRCVCVKIGDFIKFKGFLVEFPENKPLVTSDPEKIKNPQKIARKVDFSEPRLLQCT